jgi:hypothetical protein
MSNTMRTMPYKQNASVAIVKTEARDYIHVHLGEVQVRIV